MCNVALLDGKHLAALLALGLVVPDPLNQDRSIGMLNFVGPHNIEMLVGTKKPYISSGHICSTHYTPFLAGRVVVPPRS